MNSLLVILIALFYDHKRNIPLALTYIFLFIGMISVGLAGVLFFGFQFALYSPILVFGYFFIMLQWKKDRDKKNQKY